MRLDPIGLIRTDFKEKFGTPRQAGLVDAVGVLRLGPEWAPAVEGLEGFSHVWLLWWFSQSEGWNPRVRPPRLGGQQKVGVFASRAPYRPNPIGLSVVALRAVRSGDAGVEVELGGVDLVDRTPVLDIKPYLPYADVVPHATGGWAPGPPQARPVRFTAAADGAVRGRPALRALIEQTLGLDPRPAWAPAVDPRTYGTRLRDVDVRWRIDEEGVEVVAVEPGHDGPPQRG